MKKLILISLFVLTSCGFANKFNVTDNKKEVSSQNSTNEEKNNNITLTKEDFYKIKIPGNYKIGDDILMYKKIIDNDKSFFIDNHMRFYKVVRGYIFGDKIKNTKDANYNDFFLCLDGKKDSSTLDLKFKNGCDGKNIYSKEIYDNFLRRTDKLIKYKKIKEGASFDCSYFINVNYNFDYKHLLKVDSFYKNVGEVKNTIKLTDYIVCKKFQNIKGYNLKRELFYYNLAINFKKCNYLNDKNLEKLCLKSITRK